MFKRHVKMMIAVSVMCLAMVPSVACAQCMNTISMKFVIYQGCSLSESDVSNWISTGNSNLYNDDDSEGSNDNMVFAQMASEGCTLNWTCWFGDDDATSDWVIGWIFAALWTHSEDVCGVTSIYSGGNWCAGLTNGLGGTEILMSASAPACILAHEIGHTAGLDDLDISHGANRLMYGVSSGSHSEVRTDCDVNGNEKQKLEACSSL